MNLISMPEAPQSPFAAASDVFAPQPAGSGTVHGVGLGPGAADLLSVRADRLVRGARHVAYFRKAGRAGRARRIVDGTPFTMEASIAKLASSEAAMANARDASHIFGGYGFLNENAVARHYRDSKILEVGEGTTEVQLMIISRQLGLA